jgi:hypothetical protein
MRVRSSRQGERYEGCAYGQHGTGQPLAPADRSGKRRVRRAFGRMIPSHGTELTVTTGMAERIGRKNDAAVSSSAVQ